MARQTYHFLPAARDPEGQRLTFSVRNKPDWAAFSTQTGRLTGAPGVSHVGTHRNIVINVTDGRHTVSLPAFSIRILTAGSGGTTNRAPVLSGTPATTARVGQNYSFAPSGNDPEGRALTWSITNQPAWATFDTSTGRLSGTPASSHVGTTSGIVIRASDGSQSTALPAFSIAVSASSSSSGNRPPVISGTPPATAVARTTYNFLPTASDPEGKRLTFSVSNQPPWTAFSTQTGRLTGAPGVSHIGATYSNIVIRVSDGQSSASLPAFTITVQASGSPQPTNRPPVVGGTPATSVSVGSAYSFMPTGSDPEGDTLTWSISGKPSAASFNVSSGRLSWTPSAAGTWSNIVITATDSRGASASLPAFSVTATSAQSTGSAALSWQAPTQYTDGTGMPASAVAAYRIYRGSTASSLNRIAEVDGRANSFNVQNLARGTHYFAVTAVTTSGAESSFSPVGSKTIP